MKDLAWELIDKMFTDMEKNLRPVNRPSDLVEPRPEYQTPEFDEHDDDLIHDIVGNKRLAKPVQELLLTLRQIEQTKGSFGEPDKARLYEQIVPELKALRLAVYEEWKDAL